MAAGDPQRVWFAEMIEKLRAEWHPGTSFESLIELRDVLNTMLGMIRETRGIRTPIIRCPACGRIGPGSEPEVSVRAMILSLARFGITSSEQTKVLEREWGTYRKQNQLDLNGKIAVKESSAGPCGHPNGR
jgi:hypothetical protein